MSRPSTAVAVWEVEGRPGKPVRLHPPATGKRTAWRVTFYDGDGQPRERTAVGEPAARALAEQIAREQRGVFGDGDRSGEPVRELVEFYLTVYGRDRDWSISYQAERERVVAWLPGWFLKLSVCRWRAHHSRQVLTGVAERGYPRGTEEYRRVGTLLSGLRTAARVGGFLPDDAPDPLAGVPYAKTRTHRSRARGADGQLVEKYANIEAVPAYAIPRIDDVYAMADTVSTITRRWGEGLRVLLMAFGGLRFGEGAAIHCAQVNADTTEPYLHVVRQAVEVSTRHAVNGGTLSVDEPPKGGIVRYAFYSPDLVEEVRRRLHEVQVAAGPGNAIGQELLLPTARGKMWRESNYLTQVWNPAAERLGWQRVEDLPPGARPGTKKTGWVWTPHSLRHFYATWLIRDLGTPPGVVSGYMGHSESRITEQLYVDGTRPNLSAALQAFHTDKERQAAQRRRTASLHPVS
ncbi:MAG: site-specific integrase [Actinomycetota bacterium]|nr:site-specific integrase [Actinomycetota bacterium]